MHLSLLSQNPPDAAALAQQLATYNHIAESQLPYMVLMVDPVSAADQYW